MTRALAKWAQAKLLLGGLAACVLLLAAGKFAARPQSGSKAVFYVSPAGNDSWSGTLPSPNGSDGPFQTLQAARDAIRRLKSEKTLNEPVTVYLEGGDYRLRQPFVLTPQDSGSESAPITYGAYEGEHPVISGGRVIQGWKFDPEAGPAAARGHLWTATLPVDEPGWHFHELFVNGQRRQHARSPNSGFYHAIGKISPGMPARFKFHAGDIKAAWASEPDVEVVGLLKWAEFRMHIAAIDESTDTVTLSNRRQSWGDVNNARYWVENTFDALDEPGEWYLDRRSGEVYYWPMSGEEMTRAQVVAPVLESLVKIEGDVEDHEPVRDITFQGLTFSDTDWSIPAAGYVDDQAAFDVGSAVEISGGVECGIKHCVFEHLGQYAVSLNHGSQKCRVVHNGLTDLGAGGIRIGDPKDPNNDQSATSGNEVLSNHIHDIGIVYPAAVGIWIGQSGGNTIAHNEINDTFHIGISDGWTWGYGPTAARNNLIEYNNIHDIGRGLLSDMGCIYTLGVQPGTIERGNVCHDVTRYEKGYGGWGLYTDEGSSNILIEDNLVYRTEDGGFHQHYGANNIVRNNVFAFGQTAQIRRTREENHLSFTFERNIVYWVTGSLLDGLWKDNHFKFDNNVYWRAGGGPIRFGEWTVSEWQARGQDVHSVFADPLFRDPRNSDFSLLPDSPALKLGFQPTDHSTVARKNSRGARRRPTILKKVSVFLKRATRLRARPCWPLWR
jgi:parallel beta-helix repeat protein